jgi:hypothetical protein
MHIDLSFCMKRLNGLQGPRKDNFYADIRSITILRGPGYGPSISSPSKRGMRVPEHLRAAKRQKTE